MGDTPKTSIPAPFPSTLWSEVLSLRHADPDLRRQRMGKLIERYWRPVYWALRADGNLKEDEARDMAQEFFVRILEGQVVSTVDPSRGSFRHYLKGALRHFMLNELRNARTQKRGGAVRHLSLDFRDVGPEPVSLERDPDRALDQTWALQVLEESVKQLELRLAAEGKSVDAQIFRSYEMAGPGRPTFADLAAKHGVEPRAVRTILRACRKELRSILRERIGDYVRDETELSQELRDLFGA